MKIELGIKSDPIEYRYTFRWLFALMQRLGVHHLQLGTFFELYSLPDRYFTRLRTMAADHGVAISSCFTAHRELGGLLSPDPDMQQVGFDAYRRLIDVAVLVGARSAGSNPGAVPRDLIEQKPDWVARYLAAMERLAVHARSAGLDALTVEPMSSLAEPPTTPEEIRSMMKHFALLFEAEPDRRTPVLLCGDVSHGLADEHGEVVHTHERLFETGIPWMWEFHLKNTDVRFNATFGFGSECRHGVVDLSRIRSIVDRNADRFPRREVVAFLEIGGPKLGREYSDIQLDAQLTESVHAVRAEFLGETP